MPKPKRTRKPDLDLAFFKREVEELRAQARETDIRIEESLKRLESHISGMRLAASR